MKSMPGHPTLASSQPNGLLNYNEFTSSNEIREGKRYLLVTSYYIYNVL